MYYPGGRGGINLYIYTHVLSPGGGISINLHFTYMVIVGSIKVMFLIRADKIWMTEFTVSNLKENVHVIE